MDEFVGRSGNYGVIFITGKFQSKIFIGPTFFVQLIFFPAKFFLIFWKSEIFLNKKILAGKNSLSKKVFPIFISILKLFKIKLLIKFQQKSIPILVQIYHNFQNFPTIQKA